MRAAFAALLMGAAACAHTQDATFTVRLMTAETALTAARGALESCRKAGYQVAVAVVDRSGVAQVMLRDRYAGPHTVEMAVDKAWTAVTFRTSTTALADATLSGKPLSGIRQRPRVAAVGGGLVIEGAGAMLGGIGVSGAPGGDRDEICARAGIAAVQSQLDF
jgi:uncharacterized protein GlcG (DUF336 family)